MDTDDQDLSLDDFKHWTHEALGEYLSKRGLSKDGNKQELTALCYAAAKMKLPILPSESEIAYINQQHYLKLLQVDSTTLPDPLQLYADWYDEKTGIGKWPPIFITDITSFLITYESPGEAKKHLNEYKIGKAYEYFQSNWLKEVFYHDIDNDSLHCFLRARCTPSQKLKNEEHTVWISARKDTGEIKAAFCTCTAGLGQTCNHVAGLLFRVEAANKMGITACTSLPCTWNIPSTEKTSMEPTEMKNLVIKKSRHGKPAKSRPLVSIKKKEFNPVAEEPSDKDILDEFVAALRDRLPNACFLKGIASDNKNQTDCRPKENLTTTTTTTTTTTATAINHFSMADLIDQSIFKTGSTDPEIIIQNLPKLSMDDIANINMGTFGQFTNPIWHKMRDGRITSSKFYPVYTRVSSALLDPDCDVNSLLSQIMGYKKPNPNIKSLKYGRETEPFAKKDYIQEYKSKKHTDVSFSDCGLFVDANLPYLAASPDLLVACKCCGLGMAEIKCCQIPVCSKCTNFCTCYLPNCLETFKESLQVKKNHAYYAQIQGQLAITDRQWCDFYLHTCNGSFTQRIVLDQNYYEKLLTHLKYFLVKYVIPEIISRDLETSLSEEPMEVDIAPVTLGKGSVFFCPACCKQIKETNAVTYSSRDQSISCDKCKLWFHFTCVKMTKVKAKHLSSWCCPKCK